MCIPPKKKRFGNFVVNHSQKPTVDHASSTPYSSPVGQVTEKSS